jgi:hypothetical protein
MNCKKLFAVSVLLFLLIAVLCAQSNASLKAGVYRSSGVQGEMRVIVSGSAKKSVTVYGVDGSVLYRGNYRISGTRVNVDYGDSGFETWTIIDNETFQDDNIGLTWYWVRAYRNDEI